MQLFAKLQSFAKFNGVCSEAPQSLYDHVTLLSGYLVLRVVN